MPASTESLDFAGLYRFQVASGRGQEIGSRYYTMPHQYDSKFTALPIGISSTLSKVRCVCITLTPCYALSTQVQSAHLVCNAHHSPQQ